MNTISDMQNEMDFYGYCSMFVYNHDYEKNWNTNTKYNYSKKMC